MWLCDALADGVEEQKRILFGGSSGKFRQKEFKRHDRLKQWALETMPEGDGRATNLQGVQGIFEIPTEAGRGRMLGKEVKGLQHWFSNCGSLKQ